MSGFLGAIVGAASPLIIGCVIAYILNILMSLYERRFFPSAKGKIMQKCRRPVCLLLSAITLIAVVVLVRMFRRLEREHAAPYVSDSESVK